MLAAPWLNIPAWHICGMGLFRGEAATKRRHARGLSDALGIDSLNEFGQKKACNFRSLDRFKSSSVFPGWSSPGDHLFL
jgi:hypothetical protein